jgi:hypothetical protein
MDAAGGTHRLHEPPAAPKIEDQDPAGIAIMTVPPRRTAYLCVL